MVKNSYKTAFTMIELIFAIVIIAIAVVSLPMMTQVNSKGMENNLAQEAIFAASVELMQASTGYWDANSMYDNNNSNYSRVIDIDGDCSSDNPSRRPGHIVDTGKIYHRVCLDDSDPKVASNATGSAYQTLDDFAHSARALYIGNSGGAAGYKNMGYKSTLDVNQSTTNANIKILTVTVKDESSNIVTILRAQSANTGEPQYYKRTF